MIRRANQQKNVGDENKCLISIGRKVFLTDMQTLKSIYFIRQCVGLEKQNLKL